MHIRIKDQLSFAVGVALAVFAFVVLPYWSFLTNPEHAVYVAYGLGIALAVLGASAMLVAWESEVSADYDGSPMVQMLLGGATALFGILFLVTPSIDPTILAGEMQILMGVSVFMTFVLGIALAGPSLEFRLAKL